MSSRAGIVVTGTEVLTGRVSDRNGPWLAEQLRIEGVDVAQVIVVGDRPDDLRQSLEFFARTGVDLIITSGGLGPTADDLTAELVGDFQGRPSELDARPRGADRAPSSPGCRANRGWRLDPDATAAGTRKQALVSARRHRAEAGRAPRPAWSSRPARAAAGRRSSSCPVPRGSCRACGPTSWPTRSSAPLCPAPSSCASARSACGERPNPSWPRRCAITTRPSAASRSPPACATANSRSSPVTPPSSRAPTTRFAGVIASTYPDTDVLPRRTHHRPRSSPTSCSARDLTIATAESCTAGLLAGRLTDLAGSSAYVLGGLVDLLERGQARSGRRTHRLDRPGRSGQR